MGKRSDFKRIDKDLYETPVEGIQPVLKFIQHIKKYIEPCAGYGKLVRGMISLGGPECIRSYDIEDRGVAGITIKDFMSLTKEDVADVDAIITNPPWTRSILHAMIEHAMYLGIETWFLFDSNWIFTSQSRFLINDYCTDIVPIGRLKWIPGSAGPGKDDASWYCFKPDKTPGPALMHPAREPRRRKKKVST